MHRAAKGVRVACALLAACGAAVVALASISASAAADPRPVTFTIALHDLGGSSPFQANDHVIRTQNTYFGTAGSVPSSYICCQSGAGLEWTVNLARMRGTVSGGVSISGSPFEFNWIIELHGRVTPQGGEGTMTGTSYPPGLRLTASWEYAGFVDPTSANHLTITGTAVVTGAFPQGA